MSEEMGNKEIIEKLAIIYDDMSIVLEKISNSLDEINDNTLGLYEDLEDKRGQAIKLMSLYEPTDDLEDINNMKAIRKGIISIVNAAKASMLVENSYDGQRGINKISLGTLIPVFRFKMHHFPKLKSEVFTIQCFNILQNLYDEQTKMIETQLSKSEEAIETLNDDSSNVDTLLGDYKIIDKIYHKVKFSGILGDNYRKFSMQMDNNNDILIEVKNMDESSSVFKAYVDSNENIDNIEFKIESKQNFDIVIDDNSVIELKELQDINSSIKDNLKELKRTMQMLKNKQNSLNEDKGNLDNVRDDFMKNGTEEESSEEMHLQIG